MCQALGKVIVNKTDRQGPVLLALKSSDRNGVCQMLEDKRRQNKALLRKHERGEAGRVGTYRESSLC